MTNPLSTRIMLVDTRPESLFAFANELSQIGFCVTPATGVDQAMEIAEREVFEMLVCAIPLDLVDPFILLRFLRRSKQLRQLRLMVKDPCQTVGVRLADIAGEPVYSLSDHLPIDVVGCVIKHAKALPTVRAKASGRPVCMPMSAPHFLPSKAGSPAVRAN